MRRFSLRMNCLRVYCVLSGLLGLLRQIRLVLELRLAGLPLEDAQVLLHALGLRRGVLALPRRGVVELGDALQRARPARGEF